MNTYNPDNPKETYPLGKLLFMANIKVRASWSDDVDHADYLWTMSDWRFKEQCQKIAEMFLANSAKSV